MKWYTYSPRTPERDLEDLEAYKQERKARHLVRKQARLLKRAGRLAQLWNARLADLIEQTELDDNGNIVS